MKKTGFKKKTLQEVQEYQKRLILKKKAKKVQSATNDIKTSLRGKQRAIKTSSKLPPALYEDTKSLKEQIQKLLREIVMIRDKKCILYGIKCSRQIGDEGVVWQAEHLIERSNSSTYADLRLVVLVCRNCHGWKHFKKSNHDLYDEIVRSKLSPELVAHWDRCKADTKAYKVDWRLEKIALEQELKRIK